MKSLLPRRASILAAALFALGASPLHAVIYDFYTSVKHQEGAYWVAELVRYQYDSATGLAAKASTTAMPAEVRASSVADRANMTLSGDGRYLLFSGYSVTGSGNVNTATLYDLTTGTFDISTQWATEAAIRTMWTQDGTGFYVVGQSDPGSPAYVTNEGVSTQLRSSYSFSNIQGYTNTAGETWLYASRDSGTNTRGIYIFSREGLPTASGSFSRLTGTADINGKAGGWNYDNGTYRGFQFLDDRTLFAIDSTNKVIQIFTNETSDIANNGWNLLSEISTSDGSMLSTPYQMSLGINEDGSAQVFFTGAADTTSLLGAVAWEWDDFSASWGFGAVSYIASGTTTDSFFSGIAVVPEPGAVVLLGIAGAVALLRLGGVRCRARAA